jgi:tRNA(fMet)-specific endonuclease VapC
MILLDTDVLIEIFDRGSERGDEALEAILESGEDIATTSINLHEILYGLEKYAKPVKDVLLLPVLNYTKRDARTSAEIEVKAERSGNPIRRTDAMIASVAINHGATLYTFDVKHFKPLEEMGLRVLVPSGAQR